MSINSHASNVLELCWDGNYCDYTCNDGTEGYSDTDEAVGSLSGCNDAATAACADHGGLSGAEIIMFMEKRKHLSAEDITNPATGEPSIRKCNVAKKKTGLASIGVRQ